MKFYIFLKSQQPIENNQVWKSFNESFPLKESVQFEILPFPPRFNVRNDP